MCLRLSKLWSVLGCIYGRMDGQMDAILIAVFPESISWWIKTAGITLTTKLNLLHILFLSICDIFVLVHFYDLKSDKKIPYLP